MEVNFLLHSEKQDFGGIVGFNKSVDEEVAIELNKSFHRQTINPGIVSLGSTALTVTDMSGEDASVQAIFNAVMTDEVKEPYRLNSVGVRTANTIPG